MEEVKNFEGLFNATKSLIEDVHDARNILFQEDVRKSFESAYNDADEVLQYKQLKADIDDFSENADIHQELTKAGLTGKQKEFKLKSFDNSLKRYRKKGTIKNLLDSIRKAKIILGSLAGLIPGFGSLIQEFLDFVMVEIEKADK